jgi:hypothetical protein
VKNNIIEGTAPNPVISFLFLGYIAFHLGRLCLESIISHKLI